MGRMAFRGLAAVALAVLGGAAASAATWGRVDFSTEYRLQWADREGRGKAEDQDFFNLLGVELERTGVAGLTFSGLAWYGVDTDGTAADSPFKDTLDSYDNRDDLRVYRAALRYAPADRGAAITAGRFDVWSAEVATLDGGLVELAPCRWFSAEAFAGRIVSHYRDPQQDGVYGANLAVRPREGSVVRLEDLYYIRNSLEASWVQDLSLWQASGRLAYRMIDSDPQKLALDLDAYPWEAGEVHLAYVRKLAYADPDFDYDYTSAEEDRVEYLNLSHLDPYADYRAEVRQGFLGRFGVGGRLRWHNVIEDKDEDAYNVDFVEYGLLFDLRDWPWRGLRLDGEFTRWVEDRDRSDLVEEDLWGYALFAEQVLAKHRFGAGLHKQEYDTAGSPRDSWGYQLWARLHLCAFARLQLRYEREEDDLYEEDGIDNLNVFTARLELSY